MRIYTDVHLNKYISSVPLLFGNCREQLTIRLEFYSTKLLAFTVCTFCIYILDICTSGKGDKDNRMIVIAVVELVPLPSLTSVSSFFSSFSFLFLPNFSYGNLQTTTNETLQDVIYVHVTSMRILTNPEMILQKSLSWSN